jgi:hypothetical protein
MKNQNEIPVIPQEIPKPDNPLKPEMPESPPERKLSPDEPMEQPKDPPVIIPPEK